MTRRYVSAPGARIFLIGMLLSSLSACSSVKVAYEFVDNALESRAGRYLDLDGAGEAKVEAEVARLVSWHRTTMLPRYAAFLRAVAEVNDAGPWQRQDVDAVFIRFRALMDETARGAAPFIANVLVDHTTPARVDYLRARMAVYIREEMDEQQASDEDALADRLAERVDRRVRNFERFVGTLRDDQIEIVRRHTASTLGDRDVWLRHLDQRHRALADYLQTEPQPAALTDFVHTLTMRGFEIVDPGYAEISDARWEKLGALYAEVLASMDAGQKTELSSSLRTYAADMMDLAAGS